MNVSGRHLRAPTQFRLIVKNESVPTYGALSIAVVSGFCASTRQVAQHPSTFSTLNTVLVPGTPLSVYGNDQASPSAQRYKLIGLVLKHIVVGIGPKNGLSQPSAKQSNLSLLFCKVTMTFNIVARQH